MKGVLVCIEGIDGAGKHTQAELLAKALREKGIESKIYTYPDYDSDYGKMIDRYLNGHLKLNVDELILLHLADKVKDGTDIKKQIDKGIVVITDRYYYSTIAYQCAGGFDYERAKDLVDLMNSNAPDVIFYLDIPIEIVADRKSKQKGFIDKNERNTNYQRDVKGVYERMLKEGYSSKWVKIDGTLPVQEVHKKMLDTLSKNGISV
ncbi:MAG: dTMP kinase [Candidatus Micrarchaeota archaeon]|nr:dTMP kinase [Candidatus Micrarchaeota archaeon]MDE1834158.1 dTMP kinase [Candidatus Micrarchaeota archaeon]MDE1859004.1 dTMP kinase [Candidatus Micrarchaeota archaeon]